MSTANPLKFRVLRVTLPLLLPAFAAVACGSGPEHATDAAQQAPVPVEAGRSAVTPTPSWYEAGGVLTARQTAVISSRVMAPITAVRVAPGESVRRGQPLVELDGDAVTAEAERSRASLEGARAAVRVAVSDEAAAEAAVTLARATHDRISRLQAERSATAQELDETTAALRQAEARLGMARAQREASGRAVETAAAAAKSAGITESWSRLVAPFDGTVADRHADPGTLAVPGQPLLTIERAGALRFESRVDAAQAAALAVGQAADVRIDDGSAGPWVPGRIAEIARVDPASHTFIVTIDVTSTAAWRSGLFGRARFSAATADRLTMPADAVVTRGQLTFAFVIGADDHARLRMVSLGDVTGDRTEVLAGLSPGDRVVVRPAPSLLDGAPVKVVATQDTGGAQR